ncbi:MAG: hypothetical protein QM783_10410 [Phycisphaerales bacterium]
MTMLLAVLATVIIVFATLGLLLNAGFTGLFFSSPPRGDQAMGLVVPLVINIGSILAFTLAALLLVVRPSGAGQTLAAHLHLTGWLGGAAVVLATLGASLAAFMALLLWCEPAMFPGRAEFLRVTVGWLAGLLGPVLLALFLGLYAWLSPTAIANSPSLGRAIWVLTAFVSLLALAGFGAGIVAFGTPIARQARESAAKARAAIANQAGISPTGQPLDELLKRDMDQMDADAPLSRIIAFLPNTPDTVRLNKNCKQIVIDRALKVPDIDRQLTQCMQSRSYHDVRAAAEFIAIVQEQAVTAHAESWTSALVVGINTCTSGIELRPSWLSERFDANLDPQATIAALLAAAERCKTLAPSHHASVAAALQRLANATDNLKADTALCKLQAALTKAGYPPASPPLTPAPTASGTP